MNNQKGNLYLIIAIIVGVFAIGAVGFVSWKYFGGSELEKNGSKIIKPLIEKETEELETVDEITNWKTYNNVKANFTFQYPKNWKVISEYFYETASGIKSKKLTVTLGKNEKEEISINLRQAQCNVPCKCKEIGENIIQTCSQNSEVLKTFNQIVSTFKIIEKDETADWETYRNEKYSYEIKYQPSFKIDVSDQMKKIIIGSPAVPYYTILIEEQISSLKELKSFMQKQIKGLAPSNLKITWKDTIIANQKAIEMSYESFAGGTAIIHKTGIIKNEIAYIISSSSYTNNETEYYQILPTFKFTN